MLSGIQSFVSIDGRSQLCDLWRNHFLSLCLLLFSVCDLGRASGPSEPLYLPPLNEGVMVSLPFLLPDGLDSNKGICNNLLNCMFSIHHCSLCVLGLNYCRMGGVNLMFLMPVLEQNSVKYITRWGSAAEEHMFYTTHT